VLSIWARPENCDDSFLWGAQIQGWNRDTCDQRAPCSPLIRPLNPARQSKTSTPANLIQITAPAECPTHCLPGPKTFNTCRHHLGCIRHHDREFEFAYLEVRRQQLYSRVARIPSPVVGGSRQRAFTDSVVAGSTRTKSIDYAHGRRRCHAHRVTVQLAFKSGEAPGCKALAAPVELESIFMDAAPERPQMPCCWQSAGSGRWYTSEW